MTDSKEIGIINSLTQLVVFGIISGGAIFLLPLMLAEITGWIILGLWIGLNFLGLPFIIKLTDKIIPEQTGQLNPKSGLKILITALSGGLIALLFELTYYRFHMYYIQKEFELTDYHDDFVLLVSTVPIAIMTGELIRRKRKKSWN